MGIDANAVTFLLHARAHGARYERTAMLGRQRLLLSTRQLRRRLGQFRLPGDAVRMQAEEAGYAEPLLRHLGASSVQSFDANLREGASDLLDLNIPVPEVHRERFSVMLDGGTLEHVFNFPLAIRNAMEMVEVGGHYLGISPTNNYAGHGFYQFSAEVFFRIFTADNGFELVRVLLYEDWPWARWYEVIDPDVAGHRVTLVNHRPARVAVMARRLDNRAIFASFPIQSDYARAWREPSPPEGGAASRLARQPWVRAIAMALPGDWRRAAISALRREGGGYRRIDPTRAP